MEVEELLAIIAKGEDSSHKFMAGLINEKSLAEEIIAFCNTKGGYIILGVNDDGSIAGLTDVDVQELHSRISNAACSNIIPSIKPVIQNISLPAGMVILVAVAEGLNKPYMDDSRNIWVKNGAGKSRASSREVMQAHFQDVGFSHADEIPVLGSSDKDVDYQFFNAFFEKEYQSRVDDQDVSFTQLLENMMLAYKGQLNIAGMLFFASQPQRRLPAFIVKAVSLHGVDIEDDHYIDSQDITGKLSDIFQKTLGFVLSNIQHVQNDHNSTTVGDPEIPLIVLQELIANALVHRDYFIPAPVKVFVLADRIELISPGSLPNNLTIEKIKMGITNTRNPIMVSFAHKVLPFPGIRGGIRRALKAYKDIDFVDDKQGDTFKVIIKRAAIAC